MGLISLKLKEPAYVYVYIDKETDTPVYVGMVNEGNSLKARIDGHKRDWWYKDGEYKIMFTMLENSFAADSLETSMINELANDGIELLNKAKVGTPIDGLPSYKQFGWLEYDIAPSIRFKPKPQFANIEDGCSIKLSDDDILLGVSDYADLQGVTKQAIYQKMDSNTDLIDRTFLHNGEKRIVLNDEEKERLINSDGWLLDVADYADLNRLTTQAIYKRIRTNDSFRNRTFNYFGKTLIVLNAKERKMLMSAPGDADDMFEEDDRENKVKWLLSYVIQEYLK